MYSLTAKCTKDLVETMEINLFTKPSLLQTYLPDILKHIPDPIPLHVAMYRNPLARPLIAPGIPTTMFRRSMYLKKRFTDILLIATGCSGEEGSDEDSQPFEIPIDIDVDFEVIKLSEEEREEMSTESKKIREKLQDKDIRHHRCVCCCCACCVHACETTGKMQLLKINDKNCRGNNFSFGIVDKMYWTSNKSTCMYMHVH